MLSKLVAGSLRRDALLNLALHGVSLVLTFVIGVWLARALGPVGYGGMALVLAAAGVLTTALTLGLPNTLMRRIATHLALGQADDIRSLWQFSFRTASIYSLATTIACAAVWLLARPQLEVSLLACMLGLATVPLTALSHVAGGALRGFGRSIASLLISNLLRPGIWLIALLLASWWAGPALSYEHALAVYLLAVLVTFLVGLAACAKVVPPASSTTAAAAPAGMWKEMLPFMLISLVAMLGPRLDLMLLSVLLDIRSVGLYEVAVRGAELVLIPITATTAVLAPEFARRRAANDPVALQRLATQASRGLFCLSLLIAVVLAVFAEPLTRTMFGPEYVTSARALAILSLGYAATMAMGPVHIILGMTGHGMQSAAGAIISIVVGGALAVALIPRFGIEGAALGRVSSQLLSAAWLATLAWRHLRLQTTCWPMRSSSAAVAR